MTTNPVSRQPAHHIALGVQQPWAELILRGVKTLEVRSSGTEVRGTIYIYASRRTSTLPFANAVCAEQGLDIARLPGGVLVGTVTLVGVRAATPNDAAQTCVPKSYLERQFVWELAAPTRLEPALIPHYWPYGRWFYPFGQAECEGDQPSVPK